MKTDEIRIFVPEWVPVTNKGEGAIVVGYGDTLFPGKKTIPVVLDMDADDFYTKDGIEVFPGKYFFPKWEKTEFGLALSWFRIKSSFFSVIRHLLDKIWPQWVLRKTFQLRKLEKTIQHFQAHLPPKNIYEEHIYQILSCDYIIAGHNGGLDIRVCQLLDCFKKFGYPYGIYGSSLRPRMRDAIGISIFDNTLANADYVYVRNCLAKEWADKYLKKSCSKVCLCPDPAFGMNPAKDEELAPVVSSNHLETYLSSPLIVMTVCEPAPIARRSFLATISPSAKKTVHRQLLADLVTHILETTNAKIIFLPHSIGPEKALDDRLVAEGVLSLIPESKKNNRVFLLRDDLSGRVLKCLIGKADLLIGERIHSVIGSVKVNTPFLCIGSNADYRIHGIVENMLKATENRYLLDYPKKEELNALFDNMWENLPAITEKRKKINAEILNMLQNATEKIHSQLRHL